MKFTRYSKVDDEEQKEKFLGGNNSSCMRNFDGWAGHNFLISLKGAFWKNVRETLVYTNSFRFYLVIGKNYNFYIFLNLIFLILFLILNRNNLNMFMPIVLINFIAIIRTELFDLD